MRWLRSLLTKDRPQNAEVIEPSSAAAVSTPLATSQPLCCPSCHHAFERTPKGRCKCPACRVWLYPKWRFQQVQRLMTQENVAAERRRRADQQWSELNRQAVEAMKTNDWSALKQIHLEQALQLWEEGKDFFRVAQESRRAALRSYEQSDVVSGVAILTCKEESCESCRALEGKRLTVKQALEEMPIPVANCTTDIGEFGRKGIGGERNSDQGWCRCDYIAVVDK